MDDLGNRLKSYEQLETARKLIPGVPIYARIDGRSFSKFTRDMQRPYDERMVEAMIHTLKYLVDKSGATIGYTQSDELSLGWTNLDTQSEPWFGGKVHKLTSVLASMATIAFAQGVLAHFDNADELLDRAPHFDCRVFQVPNVDELANCFLWRNLDATKNSISMAAHHYFSHAELQGVSGAQKQEMLFSKGVIFEDYPESFRLGTFVRRKTVEQAFDPVAWAIIPLAHRVPLDQILLRTKITHYYLPALVTVKNLPQVLFDDQEPEFRQ